MHHPCSKLLLLSLLSIPASGETAILECTADTSASAAATTPHGRELALFAGRGAVILLQFQIAAIEHWTISRAIVLLHHAEPGDPPALEISAIHSPRSESTAIAVPRGLRWVAVESERKPGGWVAVTLDATVAQSLIDAVITGIAVRPRGRASAKFDSRESIQFSPYLIAEGSPKLKPKTAPGGRAQSHE